MKILAIQLNYPGDAILTTPALRWWINAGHEVHALVQPVSAQLLDTMSGLAGIYPLPRDTIQIARDFRRWKVLSKMKFDWAVVFSHSSERPSLWAFLSGAPKRTAIVLRKYPLFLRQAGWITQWTQHPSWAYHVVEEHLALAGASSDEIASFDLEYNPSNEACQWHAAWLEQRGLSWGEYIHFHLTARRKEKVWPVAHAQKLLRMLRQLPWPVVITSGPGHAERAVGYEALAQSPDLISEIGTLHPHQLGAMIEGAKIFIGMDSMPMHLAAAMGVPGVALFGPTDPFKWGPWHSQLNVVRSTALSPDMKSILPETVFDALQDRLSKSWKYEKRTVIRC